MIARAKEVMRIVDEAWVGDPPATEPVAQRLPSWFVEACAPESTPEESEAWNERWRKMSRRKQAKADAELAWDLAGWLHWMEPENREWFWWDATVEEGRKTLVVSVEVDGWPFPWGALRWLFRAAGANDLIEDD